MQRQEALSQSAYKEVKIALTAWTTSIPFTTLILPRCLNISHHPLLGHVQGHNPQEASFSASSITGCPSLPASP